MAMKIDFSRLSFVILALSFKGTSMGKFHYRDPKENEADPFSVVETDTSEFEALLAEEKSKNIGARTFKPGEQAVGPVLRITSDFIFVDLGGKNAGILPLEEYRQARGGESPKTNEEIHAFVKKDTGSEILLSLSVSRGEADSQALRQAFDAHLPVEAKIEKLIKGGFEAMVGKKRAFVPLSHMELGSVANPESYIGNVLRFYVTEFSQGGRNIVLSRKALLMEEKHKQAEALLSQLQVGQAIKATIMRTAPIGAFADIGGVDALIPLSEMSWKRVKRAEDVVKVGEIVDAKVIRIETEPRLRIALSLKDSGDESAFEAYKKERDVFKTERSGSVSKQDSVSSEKAGVGLLSGVLADAFEKAKRDKGK